MLALYLHIPYCVSKCNYCNFHSAGGHSAVPQEYVDALLREIAARNISAPTTVYFGGGTPSLLSPAQVGSILSAVSPAENAEITLEANPGTLSLAKLKGYRAAGVNRLSVGVQTVSDESLRRLGRAHTAQDSRDALSMAREAGFENISADLMLALPQYTRGELEDTISLIAGGGATHVSAYLLKIEPETAFGAAAPANLPNDDEQADVYLLAAQLLEKAGYPQYEISNFAHAGCESRHNLAYWDCDDYLGLGPAAHSCMGGQRFFFPADTAAFISGTATVADGQATAEDYIMLQLRLNSGLNLQKLREKYGAELAPWQHERINQFARMKLCRFDGDVLTLTREGMLVQNAVLGQLLFE